jgi:hypothetical protein
MSAIVSCRVLPPEESERLLANSSQYVPPAPSVDLFAYNPAALAFAYNPAALAFAYNPAALALRVLASLPEDLRVLASLAEDLLAEYNAEKQALRARRDRYAKLTAPLVLSEDRRIACITMAKCSVTELPIEARTPDPSNSPSAPRAPSPANQWAPKSLGGPVLASVA